MLSMTPSKSFQSYILAIPDGEISLFARRAGMNSQQVFAWRRGEKLNVRIETLAKLAGALGVSADELLGLDPPDRSVATETKVRVSSAEQARLQRRMAQLAADVSALERALVDQNVLRTPSPDIAAPQPRRRG